MDDCDHSYGGQRSGILATGDARNRRGTYDNPKEASVTAQAPVVVVAAATEGDDVGTGQGGTTIQRW